MANNDAFIRDISNITVSVASYFVERDLPVLKHLGFADFPIPLRGNFSDLSNFAAKRTVI